LHSFARWYFVRYDSPEDMRDPTPDVVLADFCDDLNVAKSYAPKNGKVVRGRITKMTGEELLVQLQGMSPEQLKKDVFVEGENKYRDIIFSITVAKIRIGCIKDGKETESNGTECILIEKY
jgi:hypothetical protein